MILHANEEPPSPRLKAEGEGPEESSGASAKARDAEASRIEPSLLGQDVIEQKAEGALGAGLDESGSIKSDSEAETIVLLEDTDHTTVKKHKVIQHGDPQVDDRPIQVVESGESKKERTSTVAAANHDLAVSSGLRSPRSSPEAGFREGFSSSSQALPLLELTRPSNPVQNNTPARKRKLDENYGVSDDEKHIRGGGKHQRDAEEQEEINGKNNHNTRPISHQRSHSPDTKSRRRTARSKSSETLPNGNGSKRRKLPPLVTARSPSDEHQFKSRSNSHSPIPLDYPEGAALGYTTIMSPVKLAPDKPKRDKHGLTPLAKASSERRMGGVLKHLEESPGDINVADNAGNTPLQMACLRGHTEIVKVLIEHGADVECRNNEGDTPLIDAVENGFLEAVKLLLEAGANPRQGNLKGAQPLELIDSDRESPEAIKSALTSACRKWVRRQSEDHTHHVGPASTALITGENGRSSRGASTISPRQSPPVINPRSPPAPGTAARRRTGRSEATRKDLLWIKPTLENLREFAGKGDLVGVMHVLNINSRADAESLIAAARGGHDEVIQLLLGLGGVDPDSKPVRGYKAGFNTPMLAAIGRGNEKVIQLFLDQPKFDPTREDYRGCTYHEISKERQGVDWEKEYEILKQAYDKATQGRRGKPGQSSKTENNSSRAKREAAPGRPDENESSPPEVPLKKQAQSSTQRESRSGSTRGDPIKKETEPDISDSMMLNKERSTQRPVLSRNSSSSVGRVKERSTDRGPKALLGRTKEEGQPSKRRQSDSAAALSEDEVKAKRARLVADKVSRDALGRKRRESNASTLSALSRGERFEAAERESTVTSKSRSRRNSTASAGRQDDGPRTDINTRSKSERRNPSLDVEEKPSRNKAATKPTREVGSKRQRNSISPIDTEIRGSKSSNGQLEELRQKKRKLETQFQTINQDQNPTKNDAGGKHGNTHVQVASMTRSPEEIAASGGYTHLPFGTQGHSVGQAESEHGRFGTAQDRKETRRGSGARELRQSRTGIQGTNRTAPVANMEIERPKPTSPGPNIGFIQEQDMLAKRAAREKEEQERILREQKEKAEKAQAEMARKAKIKAQEWRKRVFEEEHQRKLQSEREEAERKMREEAKFEEERKRVEEAERQEVQERQERLLREQRAEQERIRREEIEKRRAELEERQRLEFLRRQEQQERSRRDALPYAFQRLADLPSHLSQTAEEARRSFPLYTVELKELDPECHANEANELWMINFQAAAVLGVSDLALSQYTAWTKRSITERHKAHIWRVTRLMLQGVTPMQMTAEDQLMRDMITQAKFRALETIFWIKYSDFVDIIPRYPHLRGIELRTLTIHGLNQEVHPVRRYDKIPKDPLGWTVTPFANGLFTSFTKGDMAMDQISNYNTLFPPVFTADHQLPMRLRYGGAAAAAAAAGGGGIMSNGLSTH
ncbi:MAG: Set3 complex subunit with deacetylase activity, meiotic-specific repressor of sporulation proteins [Peltula sp. TS41687]|nr:MAG: Set3 complex subunit with deacetylase activity, meiotic-specific repressor of sporulation proteins [Peltula sp. TS41687]